MRVITCCQPPASIVNRTDESSFESEERALWYEREEKGFKSSPHSIAHSPRSTRSPDSSHSLNSCESAPLSDSLDSNQTHSAHSAHSDDSTHSPHHHLQPHSTH
eukprot:GHVN01102896.1.p1 GENE.GHVN01102896.1~~GHVN01102896.1.p1  ORF type:complete len:104 (+),score=59.23 GHVN01102896.1:314-625(+)